MNTMGIGKVLSKYRLLITMIMSFVLIENVAWIVEPTFFGKLLDALIDYFYDHETVDYLKPLFVWILVYMINVVGGALHRLYTGSVYSRMYADLATKVIEDSKARGDKYSKMLVRAELVKEYIDFFKERLPMALWQLSASAGAVIALFFYDYRIGVVCLAVVLPVAFINNRNRKNVTRLQKDIHDNQEELYKLVEARETTRIHEFYFNMIAPRTKIARMNSLSYSVVKILLIVIFIVVLFICVDVDNFSTGKIYSVVAYLWTFIAQTDYLPDLMESLGSIKDLNNRFAKDSVVKQGGFVTN